MARRAEIATGDRFFSPFIAPGWSEKEELNLRPSQDLAILKSLMVAGGEYIHVGWFNGVARGSNWVVSVITILSAHFIVALVSSLDVLTLYHDYHVTVANGNACLFTRCGHCCR